MVLEKTFESPLDCKEIKPVNPKGKSVLNIHWKDRCWSWNSNTLATWCEELTPWKRPWCWERLKAREGDDRGWDSWMASPTWWTWVWASSGSWWWKGREAWRAAVHGVAKSQTQLSDWTDWLKAGSWLSTPRITNKKDSIRAIVNMKIRFCLPAPCFPLVQCAVTVIPVFWKELKVYPCWPVMNQVDLWNVPLTGSQEHLAIIDCESAWRPSLE